MELTKSETANGNAAVGQKDMPTGMTFRRALPQVLATSAKNIVLLGYGMTLGFPTIVIPSVMAEPISSSSNTSDAVGPHAEDTLRLNIDQVSWFSSINLLCVPIGCALSGMCTQPFGRKKSMMALNLPFIVAWLLYRFAHSVAMLYTALAITGLTGGLLEAPVLTYVAEITEPDLRGVLSATSSTCVILGVFLQFLMGTWLYWRDIAVLNIAFPIAALTALTFIPESPHWLVSRERVGEAREALCWLRGWVDAPCVEKELTDLQSSIQCPNSSSGSKKRTYSPFLKGNFVKPFLLVTWVFAIGHFGGMTTLQTYAVSLFALVGSPLDKYVSTVLLGLTQLMGAIVCVCLISFTGKKPLAVASTLCSGLLIIGVAINTKLQTGSRWLPLVGLVGSAFASHTCLRLLPWILIGEVFPPEVRATASGLAGGAGYLLGFAANKSYLYLVQAIHVWGALLFYGLFSVAGAFSLIFVLPETEGLTLSQVQQHFEGVKDAKKGRGRWAASNPALTTDSESHL